MDFLTHLLAAVLGFLVGIAAVRRELAELAAATRDFPISLGYVCHCAECGFMIVWTGAYTDMPPCPACGWRPPAEELRRIQWVAEQMRGG